MMENMFTVPIYHFKVENWNEKKNFLIELYNSIQNECKVAKGESVITNYQQSGKNYIHDISYIFYSEIKKFTIDIRENQSIINSVWFEQSNKNQYHDIHNHGSIGYSSVCFINYDENEHTPTIFLASYNNFLNGQNLRFCPQNITEGSIIFFPSAVNHYTRPNQSDKERLVISFNLDIT